MLKFLVAIAFTFHGQNGAIRVHVRADNAEAATRQAFGVASVLKCLYEGHVDACVRPGSTGVVTSSATPGAVADSVCYVHHLRPPGLAATGVTVAATPPCADF